MAFGKAIARAVPLVLVYNDTINGDLQDVNVFTADGD